MFYRKELSSTTMDKLGCILLIESTEDDNKIMESSVKELGISETIEITTNRNEAFEFLEKGCLIEKRNCPEFVVMDLGKRKVASKEFYDLLKNINKAISNKIQVILLLNETNKDEQESVKELGIDYIIKPLTKEKIEGIFNRYFFLKSLSF